jgi:transposase
MGRLGPVLHGADRQAHDDLSGFQVLPRRWVVERTLAWIAKHRRCVRDYETLPAHHEAMVHLAMIMNMSRRLARS